MYISEYGQEVLFVLRYFCYSIIRDRRCITLKRSNIRAAAIVLAVLSVTAGCSQGNTAKNDAADTLLPVSQTETRAESSAQSSRETSEKSSQDASTPTESSADESESEVSSAEKKVSEVSEASEQVSKPESQKNKDRVRLTDYTGKSTDEAKKELEALGLKYELKEGYSDTVDKGCVIKQNPTRGALVKKGSTVVLYSSLGKEELTKSSEPEQPSVMPAEPSAPAVIDVSSVTLSSREAVLTVGDKLDLDVYFEPYNATRTDYVWRWTSIELAEVNGLGVVTAKAPGVVEVTAESYNGFSDICKITIIEKPAPSQQPQEVSQPQEEPEETIVKYNTPYNSSRVYQDVNALCSKYPELMSQFSIGSSEKGKDIPCIKMGSGSKKACIVGGIHSREHISISFTMRSVEEMAIAYTKDRKYGEYNMRELFDKYTLYIVPMINPDGTDISTAGDSPLYSSRVNYPDSYKLNANGVNLNRNYPFYWEERFANQQTSPGNENYAGAVSASEKETKAMIKLCSENSFEWLLDMHIVGGGIYWSDSQNGTIPDDYRLASALSKRCGLSMFPTTTTPVNGGLENWFRYAYKRPGLCIELIPPGQSGRSYTYYGYNSFFDDAVDWKSTKFIFPQAMAIM